MTLQAKLTLGFVALAVVTVGTISAVGVAGDMQQRFDDTLVRANTLKSVAIKFLNQTLQKRPAAPYRDALRDPQLSQDLLDLLTRNNAILDIVVVDPDTGEVLADAARQLGNTARPYPDFAELVNREGWREKLRVLRESGTHYYQLQAELAPVHLHLRVIISPVFIRNDIRAALANSAWVAVLSLVGAAAITFLFAAVAFRPLGRLHQQLDLLTRGEYEPEKADAAKPATDELSIMASKVSLLGQRLRGAQYEVSDLRGNLDRLFQDLEDAVFIFSRERRLVFASGTVEKFLGRQRAELAGQSISDIFPPASLLGLLIEQAQSGTPIRNRRVPMSAPGEPAAGVAVVLLSVDLLGTLSGGAATGSGILVRLRDPEAQRKIGRQLQTADRLAAISRISGGVAHEVKNPLNAILLHVEVARSKLARGDTEVGPQMEIISREILRLDRVVKTFLDFTRPVELNLSTVPLRELMDEIVELARPQAEASGIRVAVQQETANVEVRVDRDLLKQAVLNVVVNAMQAMQGGGELRLEASASDETGEIRISDTGAGIAPELRDKIFRLYFTTRKEGSGIGLAMSFRIVQLHDGTIDFASEPGKGTTFFIRLPIVA